ncbi:hypothetical protein FWF89_01440 [Candidatus Saccharibacteria bacterium]|nr:hypothetical protein [Candidatus Saccharibacteria bacterium]
MSSERPNVSGNDAKKDAEAFERLISDVRRVCDGEAPIHYDQETVRKTIATMKKMYEREKAAENAAGEDPMAAYLELVDSQAQIDKIIWESKGGERNAKFGDSL